VHQPALDHRPLGGFRCSVVHIAFDLRPGLEFERLGGVHRPVDSCRSPRCGRPALRRRCAHRQIHQRARLVRQSGDIAADHAVNPQAAAENQRCLRCRVVTPIRLIDPVLRLARLLNIFLPSAPSEAHTERCTGLVGTHLVHAHLDAFHLCLRAHPEGALDPPEVLKANRKAAAPTSPGSGKLMIALCPPSVSVDQQLQPAVEITALAGGRCQEQQR